MKRSELGTAIGIGAACAFLWCVIRRGHDPIRHPLGENICRHCGHVGDLEEQGTLEESRVIGSTKYSRANGGTFERFQ